MKVHISTIFALLITTFAVWAEENTNYKPWVEIRKGEKHIYVDQLGLSPNMTIMDMLEFFPETMTRGETDVLSNYTINIDGQNMGEAKDVVLLQMTISEISEIVIEDDPSVSYTSNGEGGTINLITKNINEGVSGNAQVDVSSEADILVSGNVNYKKDKLKIMSSVRADFYNTHTNQVSSNYFDNQIFTNYVTDIHKKDFVETAKIGITYTPSAHDELFFTTWETYGNFLLDKQSTVLSYPESNSKYKTGVQEGYDKTKKFYALAKFLYTHNFSSDHKLQLNMNYNYTKKVGAEYELSYGECFTDSIQEEKESKSAPHSAYAELVYNGDIYKTEQHIVHLKTGINSSFQASSNRTVDYLTQHDSIFGFDTIDTRAHIIQCAPYAEITYSYKQKLIVYAGGRYNLLHYHDLAGGKVPLLHDYIVKFEVDYTPTINHALRLSALRNALAPVMGQKMGEIMTANFEYMYDGHFGEHYFNSNIAFQYDRTQLLNNTSYNIYSTRFAALWQVKWFTVSLAAQYFHRQSTNVLKKLNYYTIRLTPIFHLPKDWTISATVMYNSTQYTTTQTLGDYVLTSLRASKQIKNWSLHIELNDPIHYKTKDITYDPINPVDYTETNYNLYNRYLNLGVMYSF